jgi:hypothetical protein
MEEVDLMKIGFGAACLVAFAALAFLGATADAAPLASRPALHPSGGLVQPASHSSVHHYRRHAKYHHHRYGKYHYKSRRGWLPPLKEHRHAPGKWSHKHCHDWHRCHYYFYGYKQWAKWNPTGSRAYFYRRYHH